jgi:hypothetical protein
LRTSGRPEDILEAAANADDGEELQIFVGMVWNAHAICVLFVSLLTLKLGSTHKWSILAILAENEGV